MPTVHLLSIFALVISAAWLVNGFLVGPPATMLVYWLALRGMAPHFQPTTNNRLIYFGPFLLFAFLSLSVGAWIGVATALIACTAFLPSEKYLGITTRTKAWLRLHMTIISAISAVLIYHFQIPQHYRPGPLYLYISPLGLLLIVLIRPNLFGFNAYSFSFGIKANKPTAPINPPAIKNKTRFDDD